MKTRAAYEKWIKTGRTNEATNSAEEMLKNGELIGGWRRGWKR